ncbi:unnamed protein product [Adineta ricciae]|uniref:Uncharacterized protein n=1 Tax=Adineta ricciae TaxID=249248 RepID=A0A815INR0_ADIRI|nr:unnamed protein product [Adineta ricciae]
MFSSYLYFTIAIILISAININEGIVSGCECPEKDARNYVRVDMGVLQDDGRLKCWYVANAGDDRGNFTCSYYANCSISNDSDDRNCVTVINVGISTAIMTSSTTVTTAVSTTTTTTTNQLSGSERLLSNSRTSICALTAIIMLILNIKSSVIA